MDFIESTTLSSFESYLADQTQSFTHAGRETCSFSVDCSVPQGSVLGPHCFVSYTEDTVSLLDQHAVRSHFYADDTQFHNSCQLGYTHFLCTCLSCCTDNVSTWCKSRRLELNANKTEAIWFGLQANLAKLNNLDCSFPVGSLLYNRPMSSAISALIWTMSCPWSSMSRK